MAKLCIYKEKANVCFLFDMNRLLIQLLAGQQTVMASGVPTLVKTVNSGATNSGTVTLPVSGPVNINVSLAQQKALTAAHQGILNLKRVSSKSLFTYCIKYDQISTLFSLPNLLYVSTIVCIYQHCTSCLFNDFS